MRIKNRVAIITGGASGIGKAACLLFAKEGAKIVIADIDEVSGNALTQEIKGQGGEAIFVKVNVARSQDCQYMVDEAERTYNRVDIIFNNAGIMDSSDDTAETTPEETWDKTMDINVKGVWFGCKYAIPAMRRAGGGSIINVASFVAKVGAATSQVAYTASKGAVLAFSRELAVIHARENIRVNALCPGPLRTELLMKFLNTEEKRQRRLVHIPMGRFGEAEEIAKAALFLASDDSSYMTGSELLVDGGITAAYVTPE